MISEAAVKKAAKTSSLLMLLVVMTVVPLFVYSTVPRASAWNTSTATSKATTTFSGRAFGASVTMGGTTTFFADTGELPAGGGMLSNSLLTAPLPGGSIGTLSAVTMGFDSKAQSDASGGVLSIILPISEGRITADFVKAESIATCTGVSGSTDITNLVIDGLPAINGPVPVNTGVPNPLGVTIVINEQMTSSNSITVNALHISDSRIGLDIVIASAHSDISCASPCPHVDHDFVTGGGEDRDSSDGKARQFGFDAGHERDMSTQSGHLTFIDHPAGVKVQSTNVRTYTVDALNQRTFGGDANYNGASGYTYRAIVQDNGGAGLDTFSISVFDPSSVLVYTHSGLLSAGHIEIHD